MIPKSNQAFTSFDTLTIIGSIVILGLIIGPILNHRVDTEYGALALQQAQEWTQKIPVNEKLSEKDFKASGGRLPASAGDAEATVGTDPWGRPYKFHYIRNAYGQPLYIAVWSAGPDARPDTKESDLVIGKDGALAVQFSGDDVGFVRALR